MNGLERDFSGQVEIMQETPLTPLQRETLLQFARRTLEARLGGDELPQLGDAERQGLEAARGAFVTLHLGGHLRGCIGTFRATEPLYQVVARMAIAAALHDPRFPTVKRDELEAIELEISALTPLRTIDDPEVVEVGRHGLYITQGHQGGVLLPQVATEWNWDREEFLRQTCHKAGLPGDAWRKGATIEVFEAEVFSEEDLQGGPSSCA